MLKICTNKTLSSNLFSLGILSIASALLLILVKTRMLKVNFSVLDFRESSFDLLWTKDIRSQTSENCHPKLILALENVVGEEKCLVAGKHLGKSDKSAVQPVDLRYAREEDVSTSWDLAFKKITEPLYFPICSKSGGSHNCLTCLPCVRVGNFLIASVTLAMLSEI